MLARLAASGAARRALASGVRSQPAPRALRPPLDPRCCSFYPRANGQPLFARARILHKQAQSLRGGGSGGTAPVRHRHFASSSWSSSSSSASSSSSSPSSSLLSSIPRPSWLTNRSDALRRLDFGTVVMNVGAISGLVGFMMSDVLHLRLLSITGSLCGITYNITRWVLFPSMSLSSLSFHFSSTTHTSDASLPLLPAFFPEISARPGKSMRVPGAPFSYPPTSL